MKFQSRDGEILQSIYENQGVLAKRHLKQMFWADKSLRAMEVRLSKLYQEAYISWPDKEQHKTNPIPEPICWLGWKGILFIAGDLKKVVPPLKTVNENQLRLLQKNLRNQGINWVREPRWSLLNHDLMLIDLKLQIQKEIKENPRYSLENWKYDGVFRSDPDLVTYDVRDREGGLRRMKKRVLPDAYFEIIDLDRQKSQENFKGRILLELDMSTHDNPSFGMEKIAPGVAYIKSQAYKTRFGDNRGIWLIITNGGNIRLRNLMKQAENYAGEDSRRFYFTSIKEGLPDALFNFPIWKQVGEEDLKALLE
ncbi:replication-relaxation family protein [Chloroflexota bacterium]